MNIQTIERMQQQATGRTANPHRHSRPTARHLLLGTALTLLPVCGWAGNVTYNPTADTTQTVAQGSSSLPFSFTATSPTLPATGKPKQTPYDKLGSVCAEYIAKDLSYTYTDPSTGESVTVPLDFSDWVSITPADYCYTAPMTGPTVAATVAVPGNAALGLYTAKLVAKAADGIGWGEAAGVHVSVNVIAPTATDSTPPVVTILEPALDSGDPQDFVLGNSVPLGFTAIDQESAVTGWSADLIPGGDISSLFSTSAITDGLEAEGTLLTAVPGGSEPIQVIGLYNLQVSASSAGGTSAPASRPFNVNYSVSPMAPDLTQGTLVWDKSVNSQGKCSGPGQPGSMQIKFNAAAVQPADTFTTDSSDENFVDDESVRVLIVRDADNTVRFDRVFGNDNTTSVTIAGVTGDPLDSAPSPNYLTKVNLCGESVGTYTILVYFQDHSGADFLQYSKQFTLQD